MKITIERNGRTAVLRLPADESEMSKAEKSCRVYDPTDTVFRLVNMDSAYPELKRLEGQDCDLDHLNLLAWVCDGLCEREDRQFQAGIVLNDVRDLTGMINTVLNCQRYSLAVPGESLSNVGRNRYFDLYGGYPVGSITDEEFERMGEELLAQEGTDTPYGRVFVNDMPENPFFDGKHLPAYYDRPDLIFAVFLKHGDDSEFLTLPCADTAVSKALNRLGVKDSRECEVEFDTLQVDLGETADLLCENPHTDIFDVNRLAAALSPLDDDELDRFLAAVRFMEQRSSVSSAADLADIAQNLSDFVYVPGADDEYSYGQYLIRESGRYGYDESLDDYYDYGSLGADTARQERGIFTEDGYIGICGDSVLLEGMNSTEQEMGGMV